LHDDPRQHEEQKSKYKLRPHDDKAEEEEAPELVVRGQVLENLAACELVDFLYISKQKLSQTNKYEKYTYLDQNPLQRIFARLLDGRRAGPLPL